MLLFTFLTNSILHSKIGNSLCYCLSYLILEFVLRFIKLFHHMIKFLNLQPIKFVIIRVVKFISLLYSTIHSICYIMIIWIPFLILWWMRRFFCINWMVFLNLGLYISLFGFWHLDHLINWRVLIIFLMQKQLCLNFLFLYLIVNLIIKDYWILLINF